MFHELVVDSTKTCTVLLFPHINVGIFGNHYVKENVCSAAHTAYHTYGLSHIRPITHTAYHTVGISMLTHGRSGTADSQTTIM